MPLVMSNQGEGLSLQAILNKLAPQDLDLCLFKNNKTPANSDTEADFTPSTFTGYAVIQLAAASWTVTPGSPTLAAYPLQTFASSADQTTEQCYGYYVKQRTSGKLIWAERFSDGPYPVTNNGDQIKVTPKITLGSVTTD